MLIKTHRKYELKDIRKSINSAKAENQNGIPIYPLKNMKEIIDAVLWNFNPESKYAGFVIAYIPDTIKYSYCLCKMPDDVFELIKLHKIDVRIELERINDDSDDPRFISYLLIYDKTYDEKFHIETHTTTLYMDDDVYRSENCCIPLFSETGAAINEDNKIVRLENPIGEIVSVRKCHSEKGSWVICKILESFWKTYLSKEEPQITFLFNQNRFTSNTTTSGYPVCAKLTTASLDKETEIQKEEPKNKPSIVYIFGPSNSGKDTLKNSLMRIDECTNFFNHELHIPILHTTRPARENEQYGREYYFESEVTESPEDIFTIESYQISENEEWHFWLSKKDIYSDKLNVIFGNLEGYKKIKDQEDIYLFPIYLEVELETIAKRALERVSMESKGYKDMFRRLHEDSLKFSVEEIEKLKLPIESYLNADHPDTLSWFLIMISDLYKLFKEQGHI